jgi:hypothetical protein
MNKLSVPVAIFVPLKPWSPIDHKLRLSSHILKQISKLGSLNEYPFTFIYLKLLEAILFDTNHF